MQYFLIVSRIMASKAKTGDQKVAKKEEYTYAKIITVFPAETPRVNLFPCNCLTDR